MNGEQVLKWRVNIIYLHHLFRLIIFLKSEFILLFLWHSKRLFRLGHVLNEIIVSSFPVSPVDAITEMAKASVCQVSVYHPKKPGGCVERIRTGEVHEGKGMVVLGLHHPGAPWWKSDRVQSGLSTKNLQGTDGAFFLYLIIIL